LGGKEEGRGVLERDITTTAVSRDRCIVASDRGSGLMYTFPLESKRRGTFPSMEEINRRRGHGVGGRNRSLFAHTTNNSRTVAHPTFIKPYGACDFGPNPHVGNRDVAQTEVSSRKTAL